MNSNESIFTEILGKDIIELSPRASLPGEERFISQGIGENDGWVLQASIQKNKLSITILINKGFIIDIKKIPMPEVKVSKSLYKCGFGTMIHLGSPDLIEEARSIMKRSMDICEKGYYE